MAEESPFNKLENDIKRFIEVYKVLSAEGQAAFEAQMMANLKKVDPKTKKLYETLIRAAKEGMGVEDTIQMLNQSSGRAAD